MKKSKLASIALFVYDRPEHTKKTVEALKKNKLAKKSKLFIFSDGPKNKKAEKKVKEVREYLKTINGFDDVKIFKRRENLGLAKSLTSGITKLTNEYGKVIVLEEDIVTSPYFLKYMNEGLDKYEDAKRVANICSYNYPIDEELPETFFLKFFNCWGWATWKDQWQELEMDGKKLLNKIKKKRKKREFDVDGSYPYYRMLKRQVKGGNNSWAIRWYASCFLNNKLNLYPYKSLVQNIGFDNTGEHGHKIDWFETPLAKEEINLKKIPIRQSEKAYNAFKDYYNSIRWKRIKGRLRKEINKLSKKLIGKRIF